MANSPAHYDATVDLGAAGEATVRVDLTYLNSVVHHCPPLGEGVMPCCGKTPFEARTYDRIAADPALVTCRRGAQP